MKRKIWLFTVIFLAGMLSDLNAKPVFNILYSGQMQGELRPFVV